MDPSVRRVLTQYQLMNMTPSVRRVLTRFQQRQARTEDLPSVLKQIGTVHTRLQTWIKGFPLQESQQDTETLPTGWVWQDPFVGFFESYDIYQQQLGALDAKLAALALDPQVLKKLKPMVEPPKKAQIDQAISTIDFAVNPDTGQDEIIYPKAKLVVWKDAFLDWTTKATKLLKTLP
jgi:hypothetical protein